MRKFVVNVAVLIMLLVSNMVSAHSGSTAFIELKPEADRIQGEWLIALVDLQAVVNMDINYDDKISYREFNGKLPGISEYLKSHLNFYSAGNACPTNWSALSLARFNGGVFVKSQFSAVCTGMPSVVYSAFFDINNDHRAVLKLVSQAEEKTFLMTPENAKASLDFSVENTEKNIGNYLKMGVVHILEGVDHLFFLVALLVPVIFSTFKEKGDFYKEKIASGKEVSRFQFKKNVQYVLFSLLKIVTAFTLGHSVTLILASTFGISPPGSWVETIIAASVVVAGANILFRFFSESCWKVAAIFGLIHGFGFAGALVELGLSKTDLVTSLLSFNIGVELGQMLVVLLVTPLLVVLAQRRFSSQVTRIATGVIVAGFGMIWVVERVPVGGMLNLFA